MGENYRKGYVDQTSSSEIPLNKTPPPAWGPERALMEHIELNKRD